MTKTNAATAQDELAIRTLRDLFSQGFVVKEARLRASIGAGEGTLVPPQGGFSQGLDAMEKHFETQVGSVTADSTMSFSNYRFRFITPDVAFVEVGITLNNVLGPDGIVQAVQRTCSAFMAVRKVGAWLVQDERGYFKPMLPPAFPIPNKS